MAVELPVYSITGAEGAPSLPCGCRCASLLSAYCGLTKPGLPDWAQHIQGAGTSARDRNC